MPDVQMGDECLKSSTAGRDLAMPVTSAQRKPASCLAAKGQTAFWGAVNTAQLSN